MSQLALDKVEHTIEHHQVKLLNKDEYSALRQD